MARNNSNVGKDTVLPKTLPRKPTSATPASAVDKGRAIRRTAKDTIVNSISDVRNASSVIEAIRMLTEDEGVASNAVHTAAAIANSMIKLTAYDTNTRTFNGQATRIANSIKASMDTLSDYTKKFADRLTVRQFIEQALVDIPKTGGVGCELVLDENRLPDRLQIVSYEQIEWQSAGDGTRKPVQKLRGVDDVSLDIPTFFVSELGKDPTKSYATPMLRAAINDVVKTNEFIEDMHKSVDRTGHSRLVVTLDIEKVAASAPEEAQDDPKKMMTYLTAFQTDVTNGLNGLSPEDSVVCYNHTDIDVADIGGSKSDYVPLLKMLSNQKATSLKTPSSVLGLRSEGSQSLSNIEALTYIKQLEMLRGPVADILSRAFTLGTRLYGQEVYVEVTFDPINLRPEDELEAYRNMKQTRFLELLSLGIMSDEQFCHEMRIPWNPNMPALSGTMFQTGQGAVGSNEGTDDTGGAERTMSSDAPENSGGKSQ